MVTRDLGEFRERNQGPAMGRDALGGEVARLLESQGVVSLSRPKARAVVDAVVEVLAAAALAGKRVEIRGFGSFSPHRANARRSFVPTKGKVVRVDAKWTVRFKVSKDLKKSLMEHLEK